METAVESGVGSVLEVGVGCGVSRIGKWSGKCCRAVWRMDTGEYSVESQEEGRVDNGVARLGVECREWSGGWRMDSRG